MCYLHMFALALQHETIKSHSKFLNLQMESSKLSPQKKFLTAS